MCAKICSLPFLNGNSRLKTCRGELSLREKVECPPSYQELRLCWNSDGLLLLPVSGRPNSYASFIASLRTERSVA
jgi:hypothetical protein